MGSSDTVVSLVSSVALQPGFEYRVTPNTRSSDGERVLRCDLLSTSNPQVAVHTNEYTFTVGVASPGDADGDGNVDFDDISTIVANWLDDTCLIEGDANRDGIVNFDDINVVITNWLIEYVTPCSSGMMMMAGFGEGCDRDMEGAIAAMGFENATEYAVFLAGLSNDERAMILAAVDEWMNCER